MNPSSTVDPKRFHPLQDFLLCDQRLERVEKIGRIVVPGQVAEVKALPVMEVLEAGPDAKGFGIGDLVLVRASPECVATLGDSGLTFVKVTAVYAKVDAPPAIRSKV